jgi:hypothetical protein
LVILSTPTLNPFLTKEGTWGGVKIIEMKSKKHLTNQKILRKQKQGGKHLKEICITICTNAECKLRKAGCMGFEGCPGYKGR